MEQVRSATIPPLEVSVTSCQTESSGSSSVRVRMVVTASSPVPLRMFHARPFFHQVTVWGCLAGVCSVTVNWPSVDRERTNVLKGAPITV